MHSQQKLQHDLRAVTQRYQSELVAAADLNEKLRAERQRQQQHASAPAQVQAR